MERVGATSAACMMLTGCFASLDVGAGRWKGNAQYWDGDPHDFDDERTAARISPVEECLTYAPTTYRPYADSRRGVVLHLAARLTYRDIRRLFR